MTRRRTVVAAVAVAVTLTAGAGPAAAGADASHPSKIGTQVACDSELWDPWQIRISTVENADGRLEAFDRWPANNQLQHAWELASGGWHEWVNMNFQMYGGSPMAALNRDERLVVVAVSTAMIPHYSYQMVPSESENWSGWISLDGIATSNPTIHRNLDRRLEVFVRGSDNQLHHKWQDINYNWSGWATLGGQLTSYPDVYMDEFGRLTVLVRGVPQNGVCHFWQIAQLTPGGNWGTWQLSP